MFSCTFSLVKVRAFTVTPARLGNLVHDCGPPPKTQPTDRWTNPGRPDKSYLPMAATDRHTYKTDRQTDTDNQTGEQTDRQTQTDIS